jgi:periplasmic divalent cation tolerance protein
MSVGTDTFIHVITTVDSKEAAERIAETVVRARVAGCAQIVGPITSVYWWEGEIERAEEYLILLKTASDRYAELEATIRDVHPYDVPEILALPVSAGSRAYLDWLRHEVSAPHSQ